MDSWKLSDLFISFSFRLKIKVANSARSIVSWRHLVLGLFSEKRIQILEEIYRQRVIPMRTIWWWPTNRNKAHKFTKIGLLEDDRRQRTLNFGWTCLFSGGIEPIDSVLWCTWTVREWRTLALVRAHRPTNVKLEASKERLCSTSWSQCWREYSIALGIWRELSQTKDPFTVRKNQRSFV